MVDLGLSLRFVDNIKNKQKPYSAFFLNAGLSCSTIK